MKSIITLLLIALIGTVSNSFASTVPLYPLRAESFVTVNETQIYGDTTLEMDWDLYPFGWTNSLRDGQTWDLDIFSLDSYGYGIDEMSIRVGLTIGTPHGKHTILNVAEGKVFTLCDGLALGEFDFKFSHVPFIYDKWYIKVEFDGLDGMWYDGTTVTAHITVHDMGSPFSPISQVPIPPTIILLTSGLLLIYNRRSQEKP